jgi:hypothetical protein
MDFNPVEAFTKKYGPFPGYVWFGMISVVGFFYINAQKNKAAGKTAAGTDPESGGGEFSSEVKTKDEKGNETTYTASGPTSSFLGLLTTASAQPMGSSAGDVYVNYPGGAEGKTLQTYKVGTGETLKSIAKKLFGSEDAWRALYRQNLDLIGSDPLKDLTGLVLQIPEGNTSPQGHPKEPIPKYANTTKEQRDAIYAKYKDSNPAKLAEILNQWSLENTALGTSAGKSLGIQQRDWANQLLQKVGINSTRANV